MNKTTSGRKKPIMGRPKSEKPTKAVSGTPYKIAAEAISQRASDLSLTPNKVVSILVNNWYEKGRPPINEIDHALHLVREAKATGKPMRELAEGV